MKRRIIALISSILIALPSFSVFAAYSDIPEGTNEDKVIGTISDLGIVNGYEDGSFKPENTVTRAEFVTMIYNTVKAIRQNASSGGDDEGGDGFDWNSTYLGGDRRELELLLPSFGEEAGEVKKELRWSDVDEDYWAYKQITIVADNGYIVGYPDKTFRPDAEISYNEAVKIILCVFGYRDVESKYGSYPDGYIKLANINKIHLGVSASGDNPISRMDAASIIYNALNAKLAPSEFNKDVPGKGFMNEILNAYTLEGTLSVTDVTSIYGKENTSRNTAKVGDIEFSFDEEKSGIRDLIGRDVKLILEKNDDDEYSLKRAEETKRDDVTVIDADLFENYSDGTFRYYKTDDSKSVSSVRVRTGAALIYNGKYMSVYDNETFKNMNKGTITVIKKNDLDFDIIVAENFTSGYTTGVRIKDKTIVNSLMAGKQDSAIYFDDSKYSDNCISVIKDSDGNTIPLEKVAAGAVNYYQSDNYIKLIYTNNKLSGTVKAKKNDGDREVITVDDTDYYISEMYKNARDYTPLEVNSQISFYTDAYGEIVWVESGGTNIENIGYLAKVYADEDTDKTMLKFYDIASKKTYTLETSDKVKITDEYNVSKNVSKEAVLESLGDYRGIFTYALNDDNQIRRVEIPLSRDTDVNGTKLRTMLKTSDNESSPFFKDNYYYSHTANFVGGEVYIDPDTVILKLPSNEENTDDYSIVKRIDISLGYYVCDIYNFDKRSARSKIMVIHNTTTSYAVDERNDVYVVTDITNAYDETEGDIVKRVTVSNGSITKILQPDDNVDFDSVYNSFYTRDREGNKTAIEAGDFVRFKEINDKVVFIQLVFDANGKNPAWYGANPSDITAEVPDGNENYCDVLGTIAGSTGFHSQNYTYTNPSAYTNGMPLKSDKYMTSRSAIALFVYGYAYAYYDGFLTVSTQNLSSGFDGKLEKDGYYSESAIPGSRPIYLIKKSGQKFILEQGTIDDIKTYEETGADCSRIFVMHRLGNVDKIYVFDDEE